MFDLTTLTITALIVLSLAFVEARRRGQYRATATRYAALNQAFINRKLSTRRIQQRENDDVWRRVGGSEAKHIARV